MCMEIYQDILGYYDWEGVPCRILCDEARPQVLKAVRYEPGAGEVSAPLLEVLHARKISAQEYKRTVIALRRQAPEVDS